MLRRSVPQSCPSAGAGSSTPSFRPDKNFGSCVGPAGWKYRSLLREPLRNGYALGLLGLYRHAPAARCVYRRGRSSRFSGCKAALPDGQAAVVEPDIPRPLADARSIFVTNSVVEDAQTAKLLADLHLTTVLEEVSLRGIACDSPVYAIGGLEMFGRRPSLLDHGRLV